MNLAVDRAKRDEVRDRFEHLLELERAAFTHTRPAGAGTGSTHTAGMMEQSRWFDNPEPG